MNKLTNITICFYALLAFTGCDTAEDEFTVGDKPKENEILNLSLSQLSFKPEGESFDIQICSIAKWEVSMTNNNAGQFSVSPLFGKGTGTVTVTCRPNSTQNSYTADLIVSPVNFEMEPVKVSLTQSNATFFVERTPSLEPVPEEGGSVIMTAYSSLNWEIAVLPHDADGNIGDISWLSVTPGLSGEGNDGNTPIEYRFSWSPNYTDKERIIRLQMKPSTEMTLSNLPLPFILTQDAGTLPQNLACRIDPIGVVDADLTLEYSSRSPVKDCGIKIYKVQAGSEILISTLRPDNNEYLKNGNYKFSLRNLDENSYFKIVPFVENEVGVYVGEFREFLTGLKPENMIYQGVFIVDAENNGVSVVTDLNSATISFTVMSDVEPLGSDRIATVTMSVNGKTINGIPEYSDAGNWKYALKVDGLDPNHEYEYEIMVKGMTLPPEYGKVENNITTYTGKFKTKGMTPGNIDNNIPNVGA
ncbi:MAG: BACON domain-containing protein [Muribaculaceae bacterium]|nr:BACON domain-containing protein [Muribaculaceae bacterium]